MVRIHITSLTFHCFYIFHILQLNNKIRNHLWYDIYNNMKVYKIFNDGI